MFDLLLNVLLGSIICILGLLIWLKQKITLIHKYHYKNVKEKDKKAYTRLMGIAMFLMGLGCVLNGVINFYTRSQSGRLFFSLGFLAGMVLVFYAQFKYNQDLF